MRNGRYKNSYEAFPTDDRSTKCSCSSPLLLVTHWRLSQRVSVWKGIIIVCIHSWQTDPSPEDQQSLERSFIGICSNLYQLNTIAFVKLQDNERIASRSLSHPPPLPLPPLSPPHPHTAPHYLFFTSQPICRRCRSDCLYMAPRNDDENEAQLICCNPISVGDRLHHVQMMAPPEVCMRRCVPCGHVDIVNFLPSFDNRRCCNAHAIIV